MEEVQGSSLLGCSEPTGRFSIAIHYIFFAFIVSWISFTLLIGFSLFILLWIHTFRSPWILIGPNGSRGIPMGPDGSGWVWMGPDGSQWIPMDPDGS